MLNLQGFSLRLIPLISLLTLLSACGNEQAQIFAPDPQLKNNPQQTTTPAPTPTPTASTVSLPQDFPQQIPLYPGAQLQSVDPQTPATVTKWESSDPSNLIESFYQRELKAKNWVLEPLDPNSDNNTLVARLDNLQLKLSVLPLGQKTQLLMEYQTLDSPTATNPSQTPSPTATPVPTPETPTPPGTFSDLSETPPQLSKYVQDLTSLGVLTGINQNSTKFEPNQTITRRQYANWLFNTHNRLYANTPTRQIRLASPSSTPAFQDIPSSDPDFGIIQGLAEAGIIPSPISGDSSSVLFRPDTTLTRQDLILWKVPLDVGRALPKATLDTLKETWGFQDIAKIDPKAWSSIYADFQNGDQANIRRVFGYTTLFQPKKAVTRAETAAALWYFGFQGEGISAQEVLATKPSEQNTQNSQNPQNP